MATATRTVESLDSLRAVGAKIVEPRPLVQASVKIAQGVPDPRSVKKLIKLLRPKWRLRYSNHQNDLSPQTAAELVDELCPRPVTTNVQRATTEAITGSSLSSRTPIPELNIELPPKVQSCDGAAIPVSPASNHADAQNSDGTAIKQAVPTASAAQATIDNNLGQPEDTDEPPQIPSNGGETVPSASPVIAVTSNHAGVQRVFESEVRSIPSPQPIQQSQPIIQQTVQSVLPEFKFIGPNSQTGRRSLWGKVQAFRRFSENVYLATRISPGSEYLKEWEEKWEPTLKQEIYDLIIDQNDIFTFDLRMAGPNEDAASMKPTILVICDESHKTFIENKLGPLVRQTVPKDVRFQVIGKRISTASPSGEQSRDFDGIDLHVEFKASNYPLQTFMGSIARIYCHESMRSAPGFAISTIGGLVAVGDKLYALTTAHALFKGFSSVEPTPSGFKPCGKVQSYKWLEHASGIPFQNRLKTPMDWALISIPNELAFPNHFLIDKATRVGGQVVGFARNDEFLAEEDVWICSSSETQCGILNSPSVSFHLDSATFKVRAVMLEHCLVDGDSGSWVVSQTTHKLCGYVFAKVDEFELAYMLPIEPVFNDISRELSKKTRCSVNVPDGATIRRLGDMMEDKYIEELGNAPEPPSRSPPTLPTFLPNRERLGGHDGSLEELPTVYSNSLALEPPTAQGTAASALQSMDYTTQTNGRKFNQLVSSALKPAGPSSNHVQPVFSARHEEEKIEPASPSTSAQEMQQIRPSFGSPLTWVSDLTNTVTANQTSELPLPGHEKPLSLQNRPSHVEAGPSSSSRRENSDDLGPPPQVSRNPYRASMMTTKPTPAQLPSSDHVGSLPPPSRVAPQVPQIGSDFDSSTPFRFSITMQIWLWVHRCWSMIWPGLLLAVILLGPFAASGYLIYFIVRKRHFSTVAKVFSIFGAVVMGGVGVTFLSFTVSSKPRRNNEETFQASVLPGTNASYIFQDIRRHSPVAVPTEHPELEVGEVVATNRTQTFRVHEMDDSRGGGELDSGHYRSFSDVEARAGLPWSPDFHAHEMGG